MEFFRVFILLVYCSVLFGQKYVISGYVRDKGSGEALIGAKILVKELGSGVLTNSYGYYALSLAAGSYTLVASYLGYESDTFYVELKGNVKHNFLLEREGLELEEVVIEESKERENVESSELGVMDVEIQRVNTMPVLFGEVDIVKVMQLLPGVQSTGDGQAGFFVRGGRFDQNLVLLDEAIVYNASHFVGFFSVFNPEAIKDFKIYKGSIPAQYGGRLSSVVEVRMKEGNMKEFKAAGGVGSITSRLTIEGPIVKDKSAFLLAGRYAYAGLMLKFAREEAIKQNTLYFYDFNGKINYIFSEKDRVYISGYTGKDVFDFASNRFRWGWGNTTVTLRWNHIFGDKLFMNTTATYSKYEYLFRFSNVEEFDYVSGLEDKALNVNFDYFASNKFHIKFGAQAINHIFSPGKLIPLKEDSSFDTVEVERRNTYELATYVNVKHTVSEVLEFQYGLRFGYFVLLGPFSIYNFRDINDVRPSDTVYIEKGKKVKDYNGLEPRLSMRYMLSENSSIKLGYSRTFQYVHVATYSSVGTPGDFWIPSSHRIPPQIADQFSVGYYRNFFNNKVEFSVELYYKFMKNQIDFRPGADVYLDPTFEKDILLGTGESKGVEFLIRKRSGKLNGWIAYTLSRTYWKIPGINNGEPYPAFSDRRHDVSVVLSRDIGKRFKLTATWIYLTGRPVSLPEGKYRINNVVVGIYGKRNAYRLPDYHRLDLAVDYKIISPEKKKKYDIHLNLSIYNVYNRKNAWSILLETDEETGEQIAKKLYLFGIIPAISLNFSF